MRFSLFLALCIALFLGPGLGSDGVYAPTNLLLGHFPWRSELPAPAPESTNTLLSDQPTQFLLWHAFAAAEIRAGRLPLWNPWSGAGRPLLANSQSAVFSPYALGYYLLGERAGLLVSAALRLFCAGLGMWVLGRRLGLQAPGAAFSAVAVAFSAPLIIGLGHPHGAGYTALPWLLAAAHALAVAPGPGAAVAAACAVALAFVTGHPETTFHMAVGTGLWGGWLVLRQAQAPRNTVLWAVVGAGTGLLLAGAHWVPFVEYLRASHALATRADMPAGALTAPLPAISLVAWLLPNVFGHPQGPAYWLDGPNFQSISGYASVLAPLLALVALRPREWSVPVRGLALVMLVTGLAVYGCPPFPWVLQRLPLFRSAMNERLVMMLVVSLATLGGLGVDRLTRHRPRRPLLIAAGLAGLVCAGAGVACLNAPAVLPTLGPALVRCGIVVAGSAALLAAGAKPWVLVLVAALDLGAWGFRFNPTTPREQHYPVTPFIARLQEALHDQPQRRLLARGYIFPAETPSRYGIRDVKGYDAVEAERYARYLEIAMRTGRGAADPQPPANRRIPLMSAYRSPLLDAVAGAVILSSTPLGDPGLTPLAEAPGVFAYRNTRALPRARLARAVERLSSTDAVAARLAEPRHDPGRVTLVEGPAVPTPTGGRGTVAFLLDEPTRVRLAVDADAPALLVLADVMFPGWTATVDRQATPIWTADLAFRAVPVPAGRHEVEFVYRPASIRLGLGLSALGLVTAGALGLAARRRRPRTKPAVL